MPMTKRLYYFPPRKGGSYGNPYSENYRTALAARFKLVNIEGAPPIGMSIAFILSVLRADIYIINWLENIAYFKFGKIQFLLVKLGLWVLRKRRAQIVWMFHNIHPHGGHNKESKWLHDYMFRHATLIISHSQEAAAYARERVKEVRGSAEPLPVRYVCHPVHEIAMGEVPVAEPCDVFIWGTIVAYKGVAEFLEEYERHGSTLRVRILGGCEDEALAEAVTKRATGNVTFERRRASFEEITAGIRASRYVLFPYVGSCVSSSGALIDTVVLGGTPVGPSVGAFKDLNEEDVCLTYTDYDDLFRMLKEEHAVTDKARKEFLERNSWDNLVKVISDNL